jgi:hypothetical protein
MCYQTKCRACEAATYSGCGGHKTAALAGVPDSDLCTCGPDGSVKWQDDGETYGACAL